MLLKCCLIHITIILLRHILYFVFLSMSRLMPVYVVYCDLLFIFNIIFIAITHITLLKETHLFFFVHFLEYLLSFLDDKKDQESKTFSNSESSVAGCCLAFACLIFYQYQPVKSIYLWTRAVMAIMKRSKSFNPGIDQAV